MFQQYTIPLHHSQPYSSHDFIFTTCNQHLESLLKDLEGWGTTQYSGIVIVSGPSYSGKTHFAHVVAEKLGGVILSPGSTVADIEANSYQLFILDDIDKSWNEEAVFHLFNYLFEKRKNILLLCTDYQKFSLPDLQSRVASLEIIQIQDPDDAMVHYLIRKHLAERSIQVSEEVITFLVNRIERKFSAIVSAVETIDRLSLERKRNITVPFLSSLGIY